MSKKVYFNNSQRDFYQSVTSAQPSVTEITRAERHANEVGYRYIQAPSGALPDVGIQRGRDMWEEFDAHCQAYPDMDRTILFRGDCTVGYNISPQDIVRAAIRQYAKIASKYPGAMGYSIFDGLNDTRNQENAIAAVNECVTEGMNVFAQGVVCVGKTAWFDLDHALRRVEKLAQMGVRDIMFKDAVGIVNEDCHGREDVLFRLVEKVKKEFPHDVYIHTHNTHGMAYRIYLAAIEAGADGIDVTHPALSENTGQPNALRMLDMINRHPSASVRDRAPDLNLDAIIKDLPAAAALRYTYQGVEPVFDKEILAAMLRAKAPGGAASTLKPLMGDQFKARGKNWKDAQIAIFEKQAKLLLEIGDPFQVTPHAKNTTTQAGINLILGEEKITDDMATYLTGGYGEIPGKPNPEWTARALKQKGMTEVSTAKPSDLLAPGLGTAKQKIIDAGISDPSEQDILTVAIFNNRNQGLNHVVAKHNGTLKPTPAPELPKYAHDITDGSSSRHEKYGVALKTKFDVYQAIGGADALLSIALNALEAEKKGYYKTPDISEEAAQAAGRAGPKFFRDEFRSWREPAAEVVKNFVADVPLLLYQAGFKEGPQLTSGIQIANKMIREACEIKGVQPKHIPEAGISLSKKLRGMELPQEETNGIKPPALEM